MKKEFRKDDALACREITSDSVNIRRINSYDDVRFSKKVLLQHGAYLMEDVPYEVEIIGPETAVVRGAKPEHYARLIETFLFHAPHIFTFVDEEGTVLFERNRSEVISVRLDDIQPSQFFVDERKLSAVRTFIREAEDIVIQVMPYENGYISLDGHTRLYLAIQEGYETVRAVVSESDDEIRFFVDEAKRRGVFRPKDLKLLSHEEYEIQWNQYCDLVFGRETDSLEKTE